MNWSSRQLWSIVFLVAGGLVGGTLASSLSRSLAQTPPEQGGSQTPQMQGGSQVPQIPNPAAPGAMDPSMTPGGGMDPSMDPNFTLEPSSGGTPPAEGVVGDLPMPTMVNPEGFIYNPEGLRDPFSPPFRTGAPPPSLSTTPPVPGGETPATPWEPLVDLTDPLQSDSLSNYRLVGVMWNVREPRALVRTASGSVHTVKVKYKLGREGAVIVAIREGEIVVAEPNPDGSFINAQTRIMTIRK